MAEITSGRLSALNITMARHKMPLVDTAISAVVGNLARLDTTFLLNNKDRQLTKVSAATSGRLEGFYRGDWI